MLVQCTLVSTDFRRTFRNLRVLNAGQGSSLCVCTWILPLCGIGLMTTPEEVFNTVQISLLVPEESVQLPVDATSSPGSWLSELSSLTDRKLAFFDERLLAYFLVRVPFDGPDENGLAPIELLTFLTHLQISLDASYISPIHQEASPAPTPSAGRLLGPPPAGRAKPRGNSPTGSTVKQRPPPLVPPHTPNPMPQVAESDAKYAAAEGVQLLSYIWGDPNSADTERKDEFALGWSESGKEWNAMYRLEVPVGMHLRPSIICFLYSHR